VLLLVRLHKIPFKAFTSQAEISPIDTWASIVRLLLLWALIPAVWLGVITVPPSVAVEVIILIGAYITVLALGPRFFRVLGRGDLVLVLDLFVVTALLLISGNLSSPFLYLYYLAILEAAVRLNLRQALASSVACTTLIILLWMHAGYGEALSSAGFRLGAFIAGGFLLALFLGMIAEEHRASSEKVRWADQLDQRLREATQQLKDQLEELQFYNELASRLSGELRVEGVMDILLQVFLETTGLERGLAYVVEEDETLEVVVSRGVSRGGDDSEVRPPLLPVPEGISSDVILLPQVPGGTLMGKALASVPLVRAGRARAWLVGLSDGLPAISDSSRRRLRGLAAQGVSALEAARLYEEVQRMIRSDPMQSLTSWTGLEQLLNDEIVRAKSLLLVFSVAEIRLQDYAVSRADAGDRDLAVRRTVKLIQAALRRVDALAHDGSGRFVILLPRMPKIRAVEVLQEIVARLEGDSVAARLLVVDRVRLSAGVVTFPEDGTAPPMLFGGMERLLVHATSGASAPARVQVAAS